MGRHRKKMTESHNVRKQKHVGDGPEKSNPAPPVVEERMGLATGVCMECNARNKGRETCRKCGGDVREKASDFQND